LNKREASLRQFLRNLDIVLLAGLPAGQPAGMSFTEW